MICQQCNNEMEKKSKRPSYWCPICGTTADKRTGAHGQVIYTDLEAFEWTFPKWNALKNTETALRLLKDKVNEIGTKNRFSGDTKWIILRLIDNMLDPETVTDGKNKK